MLEGIFKKETPEAVETRRLNNENKGLDKEMSTRQRYIEAIENKNFAEQQRIARIYEQTHEDKLQMSPSDLRSEIEKFAGEKFENNLHVLDVLKQRRANKEKGLDAQ